MEVSEVKHLLGYVSAHQATSTACLPSLFFSFYMLPGRVGRQVCAQVRSLSIKYGALQEVGSN